MRRILHVTQPDSGGLARVVQHYLQVLRGRGLEQAVACPEGELAQWLRAEGFTWLPWEAERSPHRGVTGEVRRLRGLIEDWAPDVVHLHSSKAGLSGRLAVRGALPTVFQPHAWSYDAVTGPVQAASRGWEAVAARWTHVTLCVSKAEELSGRHAGVRTDFVVVPNRVDVSEWTPADQKGVRRDLGLDPTHPTAVCVGRICPQKGQLDLLRVWPQIRAKVCDAELILVGDGPDVAAAHQLAGEGVRFVGARSDVASWYAAADVVVVPSKWEGMAMVPLEAAASARVVVATDVTGIAEGLGSDGVLIPPYEPEALVEPLSVLLADREAAAHRGASLRVQALRGPQAETVAQELCAVYDRAVTLCENLRRPG